MKRTILAMQALPSKEMMMLEEQYDVIRLWECNDPEQAIKDKENEVKAVLSTFNSKGVSARLIEALPNLEIIAQFGAGFDNIDLNVAYDRDIVVTNTPDVVTDDTADMGMILMLTLARRTVEGDMFIRVGRWQPMITPPLGTSISGKTVGIVGLGKIGLAVAERAKAFNMNIIYHSRSLKDVEYKYYESLKSMAHDCDFLVLTCAGGAETQGLVDYDVLQALGSKGYLINIARGSVVNEKDLVMALHNKVIAGAGLDVYECEPNVPKDMIKMDNVVLSPHVGGGTIETRSKMGQLVIDNLDAYFEGRKLLTPVKLAG